MASSSSKNLRMSAYDSCGLFMEPYAIRDSEYVQTYLITPILTV